MQSFQAQCDLEYFIPIPHYSRQEKYYQTHLEIGMTLYFLKLIECKIINRLFRIGISKKVSFD